MPATRTPPAPRPVLLAVLVSGAFLLLSAVVVPDGRPPEEVSFPLVGVLLLWFVLRRRSRFARGFVVVVSLTGAILHGLGSTEGAEHVVAAFAFLGQALPLLTPAVRRHVQQPLEAPARVTPVA